MLSIEVDLLKYAQEFYISKNSTEKPKIEASLASIKKRLMSEFGDQILSLETFGSYERKTMLPRAYDQNSDIDLLVEFDHEIMNFNPATYRKYLHEFAEKYYPNSISYKSSPSVVIELNHLNYDLVPAFIQEEGFFNTTSEIYIPESNTEWMHTNIHSFSQKLDEKNKKYDFNVKRIIRLLKAWNAKVSYPVNSFELEQIIAEMDFSGDDIQDGFFYAIDRLPSDWSSSSAEQKIEMLKENAENLENALERDDIRIALKYLMRILPIT